MIGGGQDAGRTRHGDVQQAKYQVCDQNLSYLLPIVPPFSNHRAVSDTNITPTPLLAPFHSQSQESLEPTPEGSTSLISTKAAPFPTSHLRSQTPEPPCCSTGCFSTGNKSRKMVKHRQRKMGNTFSALGCD